MANPDLTLLHSDTLAAGLTAKVGDVRANFNQLIARANLHDDEIDTLETLTAGHTIDISDLTDVVSDNTDAILLNTTYRGGMRVVLEKDYADGDITFTLQEMKDSDLIFVTGRPLTADQDLRLPAVTSAELGLEVCMLTLGTVNSYDRYIASNLMNTISRNADQTPLKCASTAAGAYIILMVLETSTPDTYQWHATLLDSFVAFG